METIASPSELSPAEWHRMGRTLRRRFPAGDAGVVGVGFGVAEKGSAADPDRGHAACFLVRRKGDPPTKRGRIPDVVSVRVRRGRRFVEIRFATDVIEVDPARWQLTRRRIRHVSVSQTSAASNLIVWRTRFGESDRIGEGDRWGTVTVGHPFWGVATVPDPESLVRITMPANNLVADTCRRSLEIRGRLLARTGRRDGTGIDAAVIGFDECEPQENAWVSDGVSDGVADRLRVRSVDELTRDVMRSGITRTALGEIPFVVRRYYPEFNLIAEVGRILDVIEVESMVPAAFAPGSSGNVWTIEDRPACLQFAGYVDPASPSRSYRRGLGQPMVRVLDWARGRLATMEGALPDGIDFRLAAVF